MFAGHIGAALAIGCAERHVNVGVFITCAMLLDILLWCLVLTGCESIEIPADFASTHQVHFTFPYSHGLVASVLWSVVAGGMGLVVYSARGVARWRAAAWIAIAVFSHWILDVLVHRPEIPLAGEASHKIGLGLWENIPVSLVVESLIVIAGLVLLFSGGVLSRGKSVGLAALSLLVLAFTIVGMTVPPAPPSALTMASGSLTTIGVVCALAYWLGRST